MVIMAAGKERNQKKQVIIILHAYADNSGLNYTVCTSTL